MGCLVDICPVGNFEASRDHFIGTCLEHKDPTILFVTLFLQSSIKNTFRTLGANCLPSAIFQWEIKSEAKIDPKG